MDLRRIGLAKGQVVVDRGAVEALHEQVLELAAELGVEALARERDQDRDTAVDEVAADEHRDAPRLLQVHQAHDLAADLVGGRREQLVLREALEQRDDLLVVVRALEEVLGLQDLGELAVQHRRAAGRLHVRLRGEEPDDANLTEQRAVGSDPSDADVVHLRAPVHGGVAVRLGDDQEVAALEPGAKGLRHAGERDGNREPGGLGVGQDPEPRVRHDGDRSALRRVEHRVLAVAEEDEVVLQQPLDERDGLLDLVVLVERRRRMRQLDEFGDLAPHRAEVAHGEPHVAEHSQRAARNDSISSSRSDRSISKCMIDSRCSAPRA